MSDGFCEFVFYRTEGDFFINCLDIFQNLGFSCINPFFNKYFFYINNSPESIECSNIDDMYCYISSANRFSLTLWKENNDIWIDLYKNKNFNILKIALNNLTLEKSKSIIDMICFEIFSKIEFYKISKILIDKNALLEDNSYNINDEFCFEVFHEYEKYNLKLIKSFNFKLNLKKSFLDSIQENVVYSYDIDQNRYLVFSNIFSSY